MSAATRACRTATWGVALRQGGLAPRFSGTLSYDQRVMKITIDVDDRLIEEGQRITGTTDLTTLINEGLRALLSRESARRVAHLGGSDRHAKAPRRRRPGINR